MNHVYYSISIGEDERVQRQWLASIASLREYNKSIPVSLVLYNKIPEFLVRAADRFGVEICYAGSYVDAIALFCPRWAEPLSCYPTPHKLFSILCLAVQDISQLLYVDCDTFFFGDVLALFEKYTIAQWYAREEPSSLMSPMGYDPTYINEELLCRTFNLEHLNYVPSYNTGVVLLNNGLCQTLISHRQVFLENAQRLLVGLYRNQTQVTELPAVLRRAIAAIVSNEDTALEFPSTNWWILDQVALWLTLGRIPGLTHEVFSAQDVTQGTEYLNAYAQVAPHIVSHYFSRFQRLFFRYSRSDPRAKHWKAKG